jgi:lipid-A-disaccharide synthase
MLDLFKLEMARLDPACRIASLQDSAELESVFGFAEGLRAGPKLGGVLSRVEEAAMRLEPDAAVLVSFSGLHVPLGRRLRRRGVPVLYLGPPQVWAWGGWRKRRLRRAADKVVCLFRFEEQLLRRAGVEAVYFGYPLLDGVVSRSGREQTLEKLGFGPSERYVVFLPGSRPAEITYHVPLFEATYERLLEFLPGVRAVMVAKDRDAIQNAECKIQNAKVGGQEVEGTGRLAGREGRQGPSLSEREEARSQEPKREVREVMGGRRTANGDELLVVSHDRYDVMRHAECACAVSGTVTAELALLGVPMVVCYHLPGLSRLLARGLVRTPHFALPNILAATRLVPERLEPGPDELAQMVEPLMRDSVERRGQVEGLARVAADLGPPNAMVHVCELVRELASAGRRP